GGGIGEHRRLLHPLYEPLRVLVQLLLVDARQRVLIERRAAAAADAQVLERHRKRADAGNIRQRAPQPPLYVADSGLALPLGTRLELNEDRAAVERGIVEGLRDVGVDVEDIGVLEDAVG